MRSAALTKPQHVLIDVYHGSGVAIDEFKYEFTGIGNDQNGSGFYFTTDINEAAAYTSASLNGMPKPGGQNNPTIHHVRLRLKNPLDIETKQDLTTKELRAIITKSPCLDDCLCDWGDIEYEGMPKVLTRAIDTYASCQGGPEGPVVLIKTLHKLGNDFFPGETEAFNQAIESVLGYDSVVERFENTGNTHYVAFFVEQIEIVERTPLAEFNRQPDSEMKP
jgi:hypothetical protein